MERDMTLTYNRDRAELRIGSPVRCVDGKAGRLEHVVFSPRRKAVTHLVIHHGLIRHRDRIVPIEHAVRITDEGIDLDLPCGALAQFPLYDPARFAIPESTWQSEHGFTTEEALISLGGATNELQSRPTARSGVLESCDVADDRVVVVTEGIDVFCHDGKIGRVALVLLDRQTHRATHIVVRHGRLLTKDRIIPLDWASKIMPERVTLDVGIGQLEQLPEYRPDDEIAEDVRQALYDDPAFHEGADLYAMRVLVQDGIVTLRGNVRNALRSREAEVIARRVQGVLDVRNELVGDDELALEVTRTLQHDGRVTVTDIAVQSVLGLVFIRGHVRSVAEREVVGQIVRHVPGVQAVNNQLQVSSPPPEATMRT